MKEKGVLVGLVFMVQVFDFDLVLMMLDLEW